ncbi:ESX secretion-associated protein EspG [Amycolatopsis sp. PS_44_ISF1]|uniref:ESX secretion-associated protein EspG n=1 Tax=Amycolatopsis sp. PS_44_ISF1 TaxID=2974917 RepID=UPI0028DE4411|nr:ESX secretion-associated protein EspG [Amycolatopsis sp. PS_44_ISF1]MDT8911316.1 ESX secretion-associated protein EspG [Amycolatopsis sp. PS_44_ISF1]
MLVIDRELVLPADCLRFGAEVAGVSLPTALAPDPVWRSPDEDRAHRNGVEDLLAEHGVWRDGRLSDEFLRTMTVLGRADREVSATVEAPGRQYALQVAASGRDAVLACHVPSAGNVVLRPARAEALAEDLVAELPQAQPGAGPALSVPESDLRQAVNGASARRDVRRVLEIIGLPRSGGGQIHAGCRDGLGGHRTSGGNCCTFYDTGYGRYLFSFTEEPGCERYINVTPGRADVTIDKTCELLDQVCA